MKYSKFGDPQPETDDDLTAVFDEQFGNNQQLEAVADEFEDSDWLDGWNVSVRNIEGDELTIRGFKTEDEMRAYLALHKVEIV